MIPETKKMSEKETKAFWDKMTDPEYWNNRYRTMEETRVMFKEEIKMWKYCQENKCTVDDLINAHKREVLRDKELEKSTII